MNKLYIIIIFSIFSGCLFAQEVEDPTPLASTNKEVNSEKIKKTELPHLFWGFSFGTGTFGLRHDNEDIQLNNDLSFRGGLYFELQLKKWLSAEIGGYYTVISGSAALPNYAASFESVDDMGVEYTHIIDAQGIDEKMEAGLLEIPVSAKFSLSSGNWNFFLKPGLSYTMVMSSDYSQKSTIGISGYYPNTNVTFDDLPQHGYFLPADFYSEGELALKNSINPFIGAGVIVAGNGKTGVFFIEGKYYPGVIDFSNKAGNGTLFEGPMDNKKIGLYNFESITEEGTINLSGFIVQLGFRF